MNTEYEQVVQQAADYLARSREETEGQRREREAWLAEDPRHLRVYLHLQRLDEQATGLLDDPELRAIFERDFKLP